MKVKELTIKEVEFIAHRLAKEFLYWNEPIPDFDTRYPGVLERCLAAPFQTFDKKFLYPGLLNKAAILFYFMVKNHPFQNGNKRIAVTTLIILLYKNKKWLKVDNQEFYNFARWVAESNPKLKDSTVGAVGQFLKTYVIDLEE